MEFSNTEEVSNIEGVCKSSKGDQLVVGCEMEGKRCFVSQLVEQDGDRLEFECIGREILNEKEVEVQFIIIIVCVVGYMYKIIIIIIVLIRYYFKVIFSVVGIDC